MSTELISVIIPTHNREKMLAKAIESVLVQTYPEIELIVVDDGSDDATGQLVAEYQHQIAHRCDEGSRRRLVYLQQENRGPAAARNRGIDTARGNYIAFLDSDDWFVREKLAVQAGVMDRHPGYLISHTDEKWFRQGVLLNQKKRHAKQGGDLFARSLQLCAVSMSTVMVRRELFGLVGIFDEEFLCCEDYDFWLRVSMSHPFLVINRALTEKEGGRPDQVSSRFRVGMDRLRIKAIVKILESPALDSVKRQLAMEELHRKCLIFGNGCLKHGREAEGWEYLRLPVRYGLPMAEPQGSSPRTPKTLYPASGREA